jgi:cytochrome c-type biogenesis protein CcmF
VSTLGHFALFLALVCSAWAAIAAWLSTVARGKGLVRSAERGLLAACGLVALAVVALEYGFVTNDFSLDAVYHYSSVSQPLPYKIGALWGGQAGSLLLWGFILACMSALVVVTNRNKNRAMMPWIVVVLGVVLTFFLFLTNVIASPFATGPWRADGVGLNPQLKNYWMMIHPPTLYLGYVAFTVPFAFAITALVTRRTGGIWFRTTRRWTMFAWFFLGIGILMGSYWAYIELGWGGYWAWDPVENASLMPWLTGTAFLHSVMLQEKKGMMKVWNMTLIILTFSLSIFGTFLTRSGIISSVHSFASSSARSSFWSSGWTT